METPRPEIECDPQEKAEGSPDFGDAVAQSQSEGDHAGGESPFGGGLTKSEPPIGIGIANGGSAFAIAEEQAQSQERFAAEDHDGSRKWHEQSQDKGEEKACNEQGSDQWNTGLSVCARPGFYNRTAEKQQRS